MGGGSEPTAMGGGAPGQPPAGEAFVQNGAELLSRTSMKISSIRSYLINN
jgi:hypothetical protein